MKKLLTGNEAIAQGAWEAGVMYACAYPGTPSTEILENIAEFKADIIAEWAPNEKVALETAAGASGETIIRVSGLKKNFGKLKVLRGIDEHIEKGELIVRKSGGNTPVEYFVIKMENLMITSYETGGSKDGLDRIQETLTLNFRKFGVIYTLQEDSGAPGPQSQTGWDIAENIEWAP